jgi:hypothetical protein
LIHKADRENRAERANKADLFLLSFLNNTEIEDLG